MTVQATDYVTLADAKLDLRIDGTDADTAITRLIPAAVDLTSKITGRDLLAVDAAADIEPGLKAVVVAVLGSIFDGLHELPPAVYAMAAPYRVLVTPADD